MKLFYTDNAGGRYLSSIVFARAPDIATAKALINDEIKSRGFYIRDFEVNELPDNGVYAKILFDGDY